LATASFADDLKSFLLCESMRVGRLVCLLVMVMASPLLNRKSHGPDLTEPFGSTSSSMYALKDAAPLNTRLGH
ncbi:MAG: hypothetical protein WCB70_14825, partial [Xanthobacteraceae bacterium]